MPPEFGLIGLGVMGRNLAHNLAEHGIRMAVFDRSADAVGRCVAEAPSGTAISGFESLDDFVAALPAPRRVLLMVNAGAPVDEVLAQLVPRLASGDIVVDGGNSRWEDTERRTGALAAHGLHFCGVGISGGEEGARKGPAIMAGGSAGAWSWLRPVFESIAARVEGAPCVVHAGDGGAGHFVKMVHNGIEYADMQLIGEVYALMQAAGLQPDAMAAVFARWNAGPLRSYLIEITALILGQRDADTGRPLVDVIQDTAGQKGTGQWAVVAAAQEAVVASAMNAAVDARVLSTAKTLRVTASGVLGGPTDSGRAFHGRPDDWMTKLHDALYASKIVAYAQGFALLHTAAQRRGWSLDLAALARAWRGGCIIRAQFLGHIAAACAAGAAADQLMLAPYFADALARAQDAWRDVVATSVRAGVPVPAMSAALAYYDLMRSPRLPANLLQAQRDFFGAHTYERTDRPAGEMFHTRWPEISG